MAQTSAAKVDQFVANPDHSFVLFLLYGPDQGLISERADLIADNIGKNTSEDSSILRFEADEIAAEPGKLADEAYAISMFANSKIIRIKGTTRKNIQNNLQPLLDQPPEQCWVIYEGGDLKKSSALRKLAEQSDRAMALPCYLDNEAALDQLIRDEILANNLSLDQETRTYLKSMLGEDRRASRNELKKLALFAHGEQKITKEHITTLLGNVSIVGNDDIIDVACLGQTDFLQTKLDQLFESGTKPDMLMWATLRHLQMLHRMRASMEQSNAQINSVIASARPPVHFSRKRAVSGALQKWGRAKLEIAMERVNKAFYETRAKAPLAQSIAATTMLAIALQARQRR